MGGEAPPHPRAPARPRPRAPARRLISSGQMLRLRVGGVVLAAAVTVALPWGGVSACSLLVDRASSQCSTAGDCVARFGAGATCGGDGICVTQGISDGGDATTF